MKPGNLAVIVWTEGCTTTPPVMGVITKLRSAYADPTRQQVQLLFDAKNLWFERGDLRVLS